MAPTRGMVGAYLRALFGAWRPNGAVLWRGASLLDGAPVAVVATGLTRGSGNGKTGRLLQVSVMRTDVDVQASLRTGQDASVCGQCPHRPALARHTDADICYAVTKGIRATSMMLVAGRYPDADIRNPSTPLDYWVLSRLAGRKVRLGAYGDPAAAPTWVWVTLAALSAGHTGYTHQWRTCDVALRRLLMASVDSVLELEDAHRAGWRTFRVRRAGEPLVRGVEAQCGAAKEAGHRISCAECMRCGGIPTNMSGKLGMSIVEHGLRGRHRAKAFARLQVVA